MMDFLTMDGYARFVWSAFGISLLVLTATVYFYKRHLRNTQSQLRRRLHSMEE